MSTSSVDVLVPVLNRPWQAIPFMQTVDDPRMRVIVIAEPSDGDTITAWIQAGAHVVVHPTARTFAQKVNVGFKEGTGSYVVLVGDDARFTPGWLDAALAVASATRAAVIGTNDQVSRRCTNGTHSPHPMIRRTYVDHVGASWDGPGIVCHEGYAHNYVDDEITCAAKQRGVWAFAKDSVIRHLHPVWGTAPTDDTYKRGQRLIDTDRRLFMQRRTAHAS